MFWIPALLVSMATLSIKAETSTAGTPSTLASSTVTPLWRGFSFSSYELTISDLMRNYSINTGICDTIGVHGPTFVETSCVGRCGRNGHENSDTAACSCDYWCRARGECCHDFVFKCPRLYKACFDDYDYLYPRSMCETEGISAIASCNNFFPSEVDFGELEEWVSNIPNTARPTFIDTNAHLGAENKTLKDFLGGSLLKTKDLYIKDMNSQLLFKNRDAFSSCRLPNAKPLNVQRKIDLTCSDKVELKELTQAITTKDDKTQLETLNVYLQGCSVRNTAEEHLSKFDECYNYASIECFTFDNLRNWKLFTDLCFENRTYFASSRHYSSPPDLLMSKRVKYIVLTEGLHCLYTLPNDTKIQKQTIALLPHDATLTIRAKSWYSRLTTGDKVIDPDERQLNHVQGFLISIAIFNLPYTIYMDCETLDTHLSNCQNLKHEDFQMSVGARSPMEETLERNQYSLGASLQRIGHFDRLLSPALVHQNGVAMCTCLRIQIAFATLKTWTSKVIHLQARKCVLQLKPDQVSFKEEDWSRDARSVFKTLLDMAEDFKAELELSLNQTKNLCVHDHLKSARFCMYPITGSVQDPPLSAIQLRCFYLDLTGSGPGLGLTNAAMRIVANRSYVVTIVFLIFRVLY